MKRAMSEHELDRALHAAINVEHSAAFVPQVRARVEAVRSAPGRGLRWVLAIGSFAVSAAVLVMVVGLPEREGRAHVTGRVNAFRPSAAAAVPPQAAPHTLPATPVPRRAVGSPRRRPQDVGPAARLSSFPEVLISPEEQRAFQLLVATAREGRIPSELANPPAGRFVSVHDIAIPPVIIEPLQQPPRVEGDLP